MNVKYLLCICAAVVLVAHAAAGEVETEHVEESTESPIADLAMIDADISSSTEKPPVWVKKSEQTKSEEKPATQRHTVADFIIHPLIAFKPRVTEEELPAGRQASSTSTTPSPWQLFGFNSGQGLGSQVSSSVSSLAGSVSGWINDRIQLPGLVDTPVRDSSTTTTTIRPDVVVRVQHNRQSTRRPVIRINQNNNNRPNSLNNINRPNRRNRPNRFNNNNNNNFNNNLGDYDSQEEEDDENEEDEDFQYNNNNNNQDDEEHEDDDSSNKDQSDSVEETNESGNNENAQSGEEEEDDDENEQVKPIRNNDNRRPVHANQQRKRVQKPRKSEPKRRLTATQQYGYIDDESSNDRDSDNDDDEDDDSTDDVEHYIYEEVSRPSTKRSQSQSNLIQRGQQSLINQIRQLTQGLSPADSVATSQRRRQQITKRQRPQAAVLINRNGQTFYVAPELLNSAIPLSNSAPQYQFQYSQGGVKKVAKKPSKFGAYPQPPLTIPLKRKGRPTQYITIPWSQLGIAPPNELVSITEGIQSQPLILNIPQNAINAMQNSNRRKNRPVISADAVPLLADASLMDIFRPPRIPPSRTSTNAHKSPVSGGTPVFIASKGGNTQRIRPDTIVEKAPVIIESMDKPNESQENPSESIQSGAAVSSNKNGMQNTENEYILVGEDNEPGLTRHVNPVYGDARYVQISGRQPIFELLNRGRFALRKSGRALEHTESIDVAKSQQLEQKSVNSEGQLIPVEVINDAEEPQAAKPQLLMSSEPVQETTVIEAAVAEEDSPPIVENSKIQEVVVSKAEVAKTA